MTLLSINFAETRARRYSETKSEAYHSLTAKELNRSEQRVIDAVGDDAMTRKQIAAKSGLELSAVCGRCNSLIAKGELIVRGTTRDEATGKRQELLGRPV